MDEHFKGKLGSYLTNESKLKSTAPDDSESERNTIYLAEGVLIYLGVSNQSSGAC